MKELSYTLLSDGSSDKALMSILTWLLQEHQVECAIQSTWADLRRLPKPPKTLGQRIKNGLDLYPCDLLFIHRDAEKEPREKRMAEIREAVEEAIKESVAVPPTVCVIPVRMQEAWLLFDEIAIRNAAGNPRGNQPLRLPLIATLEQLPNPKDILHKLLYEASGLTGRRLKQYSVHERVHRVAELINDFSPLRALRAFQILEAEIVQVIQEQGW
ncbi:DUF4276 family protein [Scytonema sp. UIC 10036]|uniref:DUF4276 family protein n=1 Tax=Scytonema sp. UIC 10036 TaxID=2304196 RepID=UPI0012DA758D|nr:DUF4276 family protein [Scytonema sp. UIC 10036]MUH01691.1 DUF4276 family protein [Scytonema sp. UIC 10036]